MKPKDLVQYLIISIFVGMILLLLVTQLMGQPAIVFVETGSMEPTLQPNDGYIAVPALLAGDIEEGDIILFEAQELGGGELTTHRVVDEDPEGYITQGDANPFVDQDGDEPPVAEGQIQAVALQIDGDPIVIPGLGASVGAVTSAVESTGDTIFGPLGIETPDVATISTGILTLGLVAFIINTIYGANKKRARSRSQGGLLQNALVLIAILTLVVLIPLNFSMLLPSGVYQYEIISSVSPTDDEQVIQAGESAEVTYFMQNSGHLPVVVFLEPASEGVEIHDDQNYVQRQSTLNTSVTMHAPEETGSHLRFVREYRYLVVLPPSLIASLHKVHPILAFGAINVTVASVIIAISVASLGTGRVRLRSRSRELAIGELLQRRFPVLSHKSSTKARQKQDPKTLPNWIEEREGIEQPKFSASTKADMSDASHPFTAGEKLSDRQLMKIHHTLQRPPSAIGRDEVRWTPEVLRNHIEDSYGVQYSVLRCIRLMNAAGLETEPPTRGS